MLADVAAPVFIDAGLDPSDRHAWLAGGGPWDLLVDAGAEPETVMERFADCFLHVRTKGTYLVVSRERETVNRLTSVLDGSAPPGQAPDQGVVLTGMRGVTEAVAEVSDDHGVVRVRRRGRSLAKMRDPEMNLALSVDPSRGRVVATLPGGELESRCRLGTSGRARRDLTRDRYQVPELFVREYLDVVCRPKSVVIQRGLLCADTYRHQQAPLLLHKALTDIGPRFAVARPRGRVVRLQGTYFHLDNLFRGFFGHALTDQVSRMWAWPQVREAYPGIKVLVSLNRGRPVGEWELSLLEAGGVARDELVVIDGPSRVERLVSASQMFAMPDYVHPRITETWDAMGAALLAAADQGRRYPSRIFCSRRHDKRMCTNREEVEALFADHGFEVVFPEDLPLPDQAMLFHRAEVIGGFAGSGMFTVLFSDRPKHLVVVTPDTYGPSNEYMISSVRGHQLDLAVAASHVPMASKAFLQAPFTVDMADEGAWLAQVLAEL